MPKITKKFLDGLEPRAAEYFVGDSELPGFGVRVSPKGRKTFGLRYRVRGRQRRYKLGIFGGMTVEQARIEAKKVLGDIASGEDPSRERREERAIPTFREFSNRYLYDYAEKRKKTASADRAMLKNHIWPTLGGTPIDEISRREVLELHHRISQKHPVQANRVVALLSKIFNLASLWELRDDNPARIPKNPERRRETFLNGEQLADLGKVLRAAEEEGTESPHAIAAVRLLLFTGCRRNEILTLTWDEVDFEHGLLRLSDSKTGARVVQLNAPALEVLAGLEGCEDRHRESPWVIQGRRMGQRLVGIHRPWGRLRTAAGLSQVRLHDLRHTHASVAAQRGESLIVIGSLLGHRVPATTARYAHLSDDPRRLASERTAADLRAALDGSCEEERAAAPVGDLADRRQAIG